MENCVIEPHNISEPLGIVSSELGAFSNKAGEVSIFGGFSRDGTYGWVVTDSALDVVSTQTGNRLASFNFGQVAGSKSVVTCVRDYSCRGSFQLLIGLQTASSKGMVCRFHPHSSKLLTAVTIPYTVTSIEPVTSAGGMDSPNFALSEGLRRFFGIVAVGTQGGHVYLLDMKLDEGTEFLDAPKACHVQLISQGDSDTGQKRLKAAARGDYLCLDLNGEAFNYYSFNYRKPDGSIFKTFPVGDVSVTSVTYIPQIGSLAVGFSFGCFQLWCLTDASLEYSSPLSRHPSPVTYFAYQEPEDDPQNFCYLWVARSPKLADSREEEVLTDIHLFQLAYENKLKHPRHGHMFRDFIDCVGRFEHCLTADPLDGKEVNSLGSRLLACYTLDRALPPGYKVTDDSTAEEEVNPTDLSLAVFIWEGCPSAGEFPESTSHYIALFDLDRYYQAQMPAFIKVDEIMGTTPYFSFYNLESVIEAAAPDFALNVHLDRRSLTRYQSTCQPVPEQHLHPSALSFSIACLAEGSLVHADFRGIQRKILADMCSHGPALLREPLPFYLRCWDAHLIERRNYGEQAPANISQIGQRQAILTVALEHSLLGFLVACISSWSRGDFTSGMNLRSILEWAWGKVSNIKQAVDELSVPFYDGYGAFIDSQTHKTLQTLSVQLCHMVTLFQSLLDQSGTTTEQGTRDLEMKLGVVTLLSQHLQMVIWFAHSGLLPECADNIGFFPQDGQFCYPASLLRHTYAERRAELARMCRNSGNSNIMLIDGLVSEAGPALTSLWDRKEEGGTGEYPPPSIHALLDIYLLETVPLATKHCIVGYLLLDIISVSNDAKHAEMVGKIEQFHQVFSLPLGLTKLLQAFWLIDHRDYEEALSLLLDPSTNHNLLSWQHTRIIKTFLFHGQAKRALEYVRCISPTLDTPDDVKLHLTVLLANGLTAEAFQFQREYRDPSTMDELLYHIFLGSQQTKTMDQLLRLPFDDVEESVLERYLLEATEPNSKELLIMHYLQRTRFVEAIRLNETLKQQALMADNDPLARERTSARNSITESYVGVLPRIQRRLAFDTEARQKKAVGIRREVPRPKPLSAVINPAKSAKVISHALLLNAVLNRIAEARSVMKADQTPTNLLDDSYDSSPCMEPFVGTPMTPRNRTIRSEDVSVVYPEVIEAEESVLCHSHVSALNVSVNQSLRGLTLMETPKALKEPYKRPPLDYSGAEALSLLQTPPVRMRVPPVKQEPGAVPPTPQSILKVRKAIRRSPSPPKVVVERAQGLAAFDIVMPSPPPFQRKTLSFAEDDAEKAKEATPGRRIRFSEDTVSQDSSSPEINELIPEPPNFALRQQTPSPLLDPQAWGTPPISPDTSPDRELSESPSCQLPLEGVLERAGAESNGTDTEEGYLIVTPKSKPPTPQKSLVLPTPKHLSEQEEKENAEDEIFQILSVDEDAPTPLMTDGMQVGFGAGRRGLMVTEDQEEEEAMDEEDEEVTFNFSLRQGLSAGPGTSGWDENEVALPTNDEVDVAGEMEMEDDEGQTQVKASSGMPPGSFQPSPREPIHSINPFKFGQESRTEPSAADVPCTSAALPSPPRALWNIDIEQAFVEKSSPTCEDWQLTFDLGSEEEEKEERKDQDRPEDDEIREPKVRFGEEAVFEIPSAVPQHLQESVQIQTSPMIGPTTAAGQQVVKKLEMAVQTTPGLALSRAQQVERTPPSIPSEALQQPREQEEQEEQEATGGEEVAPVRDGVPEIKDKEVLSKTPRSARAKTKTPPRSSPRTRAHRQQEEEKPATPAQPSFIFSPPLTRSRGRRSARKTIALETTPSMPPMSQCHPVETTLTIPIPSPLPSLQASGRASTRRRGRQSAVVLPTQVQEQPPSSRGRRRSALSSMENSPSSTDHVVLLTPEPEAGTEVRRNPRRAVRVASHSMILRTPQERKIRKIKPW